MNFNTLLLRLGIESNDFINKDNATIQIDNGYHNFERFRKRAMLIITYSKRTHFSMCPINTINLTVSLSCSWKSTI